jgi:hypothetical protein
VTLWVRHVPPVAPSSGTAAWQGELRTVADLPLLRRRLRAAVCADVLPSGTDDGERLLLVFEEIGSNALRHGRAPVLAGVTPTDSAWLLSVSDAAPDRPPTPAVDRDPAEGGMGLGLVARLCRVHGWTVDGDRKIVWARVPYEDIPRPLTPRVRAATAQTRRTATRLAGTAERLTETFDRLANQASRTGRPAAAGTYRAGVTRARHEAERARRISRASSPLPEPLADCLAG